MVLLVSRIEILELSKLLLNNSVGLCWQVELLDLDKQLINFIQLVIAAEISWLSASASTHRVLLEGHDLAVVIVLYFLEYVPNGIPALLLVEAIVGIGALHELLDPTHLLSEDLVEPSQPLVKAINLEHLLPLLSTLVPDDESDQEQKSDWLVLGLVDPDGVVHQHSALRFGQRGVHLHQLQPLLFEIGELVLTLRILRQRVILLHVVDESDFAHLDDLIIVSKDDFLDAESLHGLDAELGVVLDQVGDDLLLVNDLDEDADRVVILEFVAG